MWFRGHQATVCYSATERMSLKRMGGLGGSGCPSSKPPVMVHAPSSGASLGGWQREDWPWEEGHVG